MMGAAAIMFALPLLVWFWRKELINLMADAIAEGIKRDREREPVE